MLYNQEHVVCIISPSSPMPEGLLGQSIEYFESLGFKVKTGKHLYKKELFAAGAVEERAADIMDCFKDPEVSIIMSTNGGTSAIRALPLLNYITRIMDE